MSTSSDGFLILRGWQHSAKPLRVFSFGTIPYVEEGAGAMVKSFGLDAHGERNLVLAVTGPIPPLEPSFPLAGAEFALAPPHSTPQDFPLPSATINDYRFFLWVKLRDKTTLLLAEPL